MSENLDLNINIQTKGTEVIGLFRKEIKEANGELLKAQTLYGDYSAEAVKAAQKVALLKDKIQEARETSDLFDPGKKFQALTGSLTAVAGGFGAIQGAMALFGVESDNVQKALLKVNAAMALSQGLSTIKDSAKDFERLGSMIKLTTFYQQANNAVNVIATTIMRALGISVNTTSVAFTRLKIAIAATGIGLLVAGIALAVTAFENFAGAAEKAEEAQKKLNKQIQDGAKVQLEGEIASLDRQEKLEIAKAKLKGATEEEIFKIEQSYRKLKIDAQQRYVNEIANVDAKAAADTENAIKNAANDAEVARLTEQKRKQQIIEEQKEEIEKYNEWLLNQELIAFEKRKEQSKKLNKESIGSDGMTDSERKKKEEDDAKAKADAEKAMQEFNENSEKNGLGKILAIRAAADLQSIKDAEDTAAAKKRIDELEKESKQATAYAISDIVAGLSNAIGQETAAGKAIAIASATIDTYLSASTIFKQASKNPITVVNPAYPYLMAAPAVLGGIARVKQIASVSVPKGGGSSAGMPSMSSAAPMPPQLPMASTTNLSQQTINDIGNQAVRAYVIESDVTSSQERITAIRQRARFS
jgi:hypothetical protein